MFKKLLIANRGEIACRVMRTAQRLGMRTVAVYSDADRNARHVRAADEARHIGPASARESYLNMEAILAAARASGAEAIHPGYGFLSENAAFARACAQAGVVFVGPTPEAIAAMGDKSAAKALMQRAGVPLVPGYHGERQEAAFLAEEAGRIGYPVLIKASAGGGGKGMRVVRKPEEFAAALAGAQREAKSAFGDDRVLVEKYLERPRHIEVQVFGDTHGRLVYLYERDCSVQRRHQKVLEEAPAPGMTQARRREMGEAAVAAAKAIAYVGAGTVEFIADTDGRFYFMEMNTRLQVEHPVTEMVTGLDLVEWQLRVAAGEPLPRGQEELSLRGHSIEARIYAENPQRNFLPATGRLAHLVFPPEAEDVRIETGVDAGAEITPYYDPMIAKLVVWGADRDTAVARMQQALAQTEIAGLATNVEFLGRVLASRAFRGADLDTGLIERHRAELLPPRAAASDTVLGIAALAELLERAETARRPGDPCSPWGLLDGWRLNQPARQRLVFVEQEQRHEILVEFLRDGYLLSVSGRPYLAAAERQARHRLRLRLGERTLTASAVRLERHWHVFHEGMQYALARADALVVDAPETPNGSLTAPMPGKIVAVLVDAGAKVKKGTPLIVLEAMKMEHTILAPSDGIVRAVRYAVGAQVTESAQLVDLEAG